MESRAKMQKESQAAWYAWNTPPPPTEKAKVNFSAYEPAVWCVSLQKGRLCSMCSIVFQLLKTFFFQVKANFKYPA